jgi:hypothetical protein
MQAEKYHHQNREPEGRHGKTEKNENSRQPVKQRILFHRRENTDRYGQQKNRKYRKNIQQ